MRLAGLLLGIISSILGLLSAISFVTGIYLMSSSNYSFGGIIEISKNTMLTLSWFSVILFAVGLVFSCLVMSKPEISGDLMVIVSIVGLLFSAGTYFAYVMYGLLLIAGIFTNKGAREVEPKYHEVDNDVEEEVRKEKDISLLRMLINPKKY